MVVVIKLIHQARTQTWGYFDLLIENGSFLRRYQLRTQGGRGSKLPFWNSKKQQFFLI